MRVLPTGTVTLIFTDIEGSTHLLRQVGERYAHVLEACRHLLRAAFHANRGHEVDTQGDAFFVAFARATDAVSAAVAAQHALSNHDWPDGLAVRVRMGLHTGEPELSTEGYVGLDVHRAARIMSAGHGGQVLLSQATRDLVEHVLPEGVSLRDLGEHRLKDLGHPTRLFQLVIEGLAADFPPLKTLDSHLNNLPTQPTAFIGREKEVAAVQQHLLRQDVRLVTLTGPGGVGKTRLGLQAAAEASEHFVDGTWFVSLAPISDSDLVIPAIAHTLDVREAGGRSLLDQLKAFLREKQLLLLLDNFEQVVNAANQVADLLGACPRLTVLVTSREALHVRAEQEFPVPTLALPDPKHLPDLTTLSQYEAVALFIERAQAVQPDFQVTNPNAPAVAEICARLDGLPLAIELAAARIKLFPPQALLTRLEQRLQLLTRSARDVPARQQTLRKTIQWSYDLLTAPEQRLFRRLSVFVGGCTLEAIEAITERFGDDLAPVLDAVASLIDKNLLRQTAPEGEDIRLTMLETIREYGLERLAEQGEKGSVQAAHASYFVQLAEKREPESWGPQQAAWFGWVEHERENLRAAMQIVLALDAGELALRLGTSLWFFWFTRGRTDWIEGSAFLDRALEKNADVGGAVRVEALFCVGLLAMRIGDMERAEALCRESLAIFQELGDRRGIGEAYYFLGYLAMMRGDFTVARPLLEEGLALCREVGNRRTIGWVLIWLGWVIFHQGEYRRGILLTEEGLTLFREVGNVLAVDTAVQNLAVMYLSFASDAAKARALAEEGLALARELGDKVDEGGAFFVLSDIALHQGQTALARSLIEEGALYWKEWVDTEAKSSLVWHLARVEAREGDLAAARAHFEEYLNIVNNGNSGNNPWDIAICLEGLASVLAAQGETMLAASLWGSAASLREGCGIMLTPVERADYEPAVAAARTRLDQQAFAEAWAEGRTMTLEQVLAALARPAAAVSPSAGQPPITSAKPGSIYPAGLSAREVGVLRLVAQGLTDAQVAERLVISPRTVNTHLTSIYHKLGVDSRTAATRAPIEHHLV